MKKKINIVVSKAFPKVHRRSGEPTHFASKIINGEKLHTIRQNYDLWAVNAEKMKTGNFVLSVRQWSDMPYRSKQRVVCNCEEPIAVEHIGMRYHAETDSIAVVVEDRVLTEAEIDALAKNDGLSDINDFKDWFFWKQRNKEDAVFKGVIIHFTSLRYGKTVD